MKFRLHGEARAVRLTRIHLEEDAGKNIHADASKSLVDYNRAGVPLCEIVSEPDIRSADEAAEYVRAIRTLVRYLGIGDGNMEEGSLRCDANVSLRPRGATALGTKTEIKNMNSFKNVRDAIEHEIKRQAALLDGGGRVVQETRLWDRGARGDAVDALEGAGARLPLFPRAGSAAGGGRRRRARGAARKALPELPEDRFARYTGPVGLSPQDAGVLVAEREIADYFDAAVAAGAPAKRAANWVINEVLARVDDARQLGDADLPVPPRGAGRAGDAGRERHALGQAGQGRLRADVDRAPDRRRHRRRRRPGPGLRRGRAGGGVQRVIAAHPDEAARFPSNPKLMGFFVGAVMKETGGKGNPKAVNEILRRAPRLTRERRSLNYAARSEDLIPCTPSFHPEESSTAWPRGRPFASRSSKVGPVRR